MGGRDGEMKEKSWKEKRKQGHVQQKTHVDVVFGYLCMFQCIELKTASMHNGHITVIL